MSSGIPFIGTQTPLHHRRTIVALHQGYTQAMSLESPRSPPHMLKPVPPIVLGDIIVPPELHNRIFAFLFIVPQRSERLAETIHLVLLKCTQAPLHTAVIRKPILVTELLGALLHSVLTDCNILAHCSCNHHVILRSRPTTIPILLNHRRHFRWKSVAEIIRRTESTQRSSFSSQIRVRFQYTLDGKPREVLCIGGSTNGNRNARGRVQHLLDNNVVGLGRIHLHSSVRACIVHEGAADVEAELSDASTWRWGILLLWRLSTEGAEGWPYLRNTIGKCRKSRAQG